MNERQFSSLFSGFWHAALPNLESVVRTLNLAVEREHKPLASRITPDRRDIVSETSFQFALLRANRAGAPTPRDLSVAFEAAVRFLREPLSVQRAFSDLNAGEIAEVRVLADRLLQFAYRRMNMLGAGRVEFAPKFRGHGALGECQGDFEIADRLIEMKCVDRTFRSTDFRQLLTYAALGYLGGTRKYASLALYNPLRGTSVAVTTDELVHSAGGKTKEEFFYELSYALSSGEVSR